MPFRGSRREFFANTAALAAAMKLPALEMPKSPDVVKSPFRVVTGHGRPAAYGIAVVDSALTNWCYRPTTVLAHSVQ